MARAFFGGAEYLARPLTPAIHVSAVPACSGGPCRRRRSSAAFAAGTWPVRLNDPVAFFVAAPEFQARLAAEGPAALVARLYQDVLGRAAAPAEVSAWAGFLAVTGDALGLALGFFGSPEYLGPRGPWPATFAPLSRPPGPRASRGGVRRVDGLRGRADRSRARGGRRERRVPVALRPVSAGPAAGREPRGACISMIARVGSVAAAPWGCFHCISMFARLAFGSARPSCYSPADERREGPQASLDHTRGLARHRRRHVGLAPPARGGGGAPRGDRAAPVQPLRPPRPGLLLALVLLHALLGVRAILLDFGLPRPLAPRAPRRRLVLGVVIFTVFWSWRWY